MDVSDFKAGMRRLASSVCLITTCSPDGERYGLTATAVCSLSAAPPMLIACLNRGSHSFPVVVRSRRFCVNVVRLEDAGVAHHFSGDRPAVEKFTAGEWRTGATGAPMLATALAAFDCELDQVIEAGTHGICIGRVMEVSLAPEGSRPLLYTEGGYGRFTAADAESALTAS